MSWAQRIVADLTEHGPASVATLAERMGVPTKTLSERIARVHRSGVIHIVDWHGAQRGVYAAGAGVDKRRPAPRTVAQRCAKYRRDPVKALGRLMSDRARLARKRKPPPQTWLSALQ